MAVWATPSQIFGLVGRLAWADVASSGCGRVVCSRQASVLCTKHPMRRTDIATWAAPVLLLAASLAAGCKPKNTDPPKVDPAEAALRSAAAFVHCVEGGNTACVRPGLNHGAWDAFFLLGWLADGSPPSILEALSRELVAHSDPKVVQGKFVRDVDALASPLRGAECDPQGGQPISPLIDQLQQAARERLGRLGMLSKDMEGVIQGLGDEARDGLADGYLVRMSCKREPYQLYLAAASEGNRYSVVGATVALPRFLGGDGASSVDPGKALRARTLGLTGRVAPVAPGTVDLWVPVPMEVF